MNAGEKNTDELYLALRGARERLCRVQSGHGLDPADVLMLSAAVNLIDSVATRRCPQWSRHDRADAETCAIEYGVRWAGEVLIDPIEETIARAVTRRRGTVVQRRVWRGPWRPVEDDPPPPARTD